MSGGGDSVGTGATTAAKAVPGSTATIVGVMATQTVCGAGSSGVAGMGAHLEQHIEVCPQSLPGSSLQPWSSQPS